VSFRDAFTWAFGMGLGTALAGLVALAIILGALVALAAWIG
jgi:hypothetical protein